jgi:hypothetical protein
MMLYTSQVSFSWFTGFPWEAEATFPQFNPSAYFGQALQHQDWVICKKSGDYFILQRYARAR